MVEILTAIVPSIGVGILFFIAIRGILRADQKEREALERNEPPVQNESQNGR